MPEIASEMQMHDKETIVHMRAACELAARVLENAGKLVKVSVHFRSNHVTDSLDNAQFAHCLCAPFVYKTCLVFYVYSVMNYSFSEISIASFYQPSVTTDEIDRAVHKMIIDAGAYPSPLGYGGFPKSVCTSVNECMCHGIPDSRALEVHREALP